MEPENGTFEEDSSVQRAPCQVPVEFSGVYVYTHSLYKL